MNLRIALIAASVVAVGCNTETQPELLNPQEDADSSNAAGNEATGETEMMFALTAAPDDGTMSDDELADASAAATSEQLGGSCVTSVIEGNVVTYTLDGCTGPFGFITLSGDLVATYTIQPGGVHADIVGTDLRVNEGVASVQASVLHSVDGTTHTLEVDTNWTGETKAGDKTARVGDYVSTIDPAAGCVTLDGDWSTSIGAISWNTVVDAFQVCSGECPSDGGSIQWQGARVTTTVSYDGTSTASWENTNDRSGTVRLSCGN